jgi:hypothetical protein
MNSFAWRFWRLGCAREGATSIQGWRRVIGRLWWLCT